MHACTTQAYLALSSKLLRKALATILLVIFEYVFLPSQRRITRETSEVFYMPRFVFSLRVVTKYELKGGAG